ncbi:MAG: hypothetical protein JKY33_01270 [Bacteroidia bacterium]|nr:hypothetical protein [Bacteroidia bacterium]
MRNLIKGMKTICLIAVLMFTVNHSDASGLVVLNDGDRNHAIGKAHSAMVDCIKGSGYGNVYTFASYYDGKWTVTFYVKPYCPKDAFCILWIIHLGTVTLDSDFNVLSSTCSFSTI